MRASCVHFGTDGIISVAGADVRETAERGMLHPMKLAYLQSRRPSLSGFALATNRQSPAALQKRRTFARWSESSSLA